MRVHIFGINYAPEETGIAPYTTALAEHLAIRGDDVRVTTGVPHYPEWRRRAGHGGLRRHEWRNGVEVVRLAHYVPGTQTGLRRATYEATFALHALTDVAAGTDVIVGVIPALGGGLVAASASVVRRAPLMLVTQDLMGPATAQSGITGGGRLTGAVSRVERAVVSRADAVVVPSASFAPYLMTLGVAGDRIRRIPNWTHVDPPRADRADTRRALGWKPDETVVLHAGNIGFKQDLESVVPAAQLAVAQGMAMRFVFVGDGSRRDVLEQAASGVPNIELRPPVEPERFTDTLAAADVLLLHQRASVADMAFPSKLTSYFTAGRPVVAVVAGDSEVAAEVARSGAGVVVAPGDVGGLLAAIATASGSEADRMGAAGRRYSDEELSAPAALGAYTALVDELASSGRRVKHQAVRATRTRRRGKALTRDPRSRKI